MKHGFIVFIFAKKRVEELKVKHWLVGKLKDGRYFFEAPVFALLLIPRSGVLFEDIDFVHFRNVFAVGLEHLEKFLAGYGHILVALEMHL